MENKHILATFLLAAVFVGAQSYGLWDNEVDVGDEPVSSKFFN